MSKHKKYFTELSLHLVYIKILFLVKIQLNRLTTSGVIGQMFFFCLARVIVIGTRDYLKRRLLYKRTQ